MFLFFLFVMWIWLLFAVFADLFRSAMSGLEEGTLDGRSDRHAVPGRAGVLDRTRWDDAGSFDATRDRDGVRTGRPHQDGRRFVLQCR
jgi:hypothetical protein